MCNWTVSRFVHFLMWLCTVHRVHPYAAFCVYCLHDTPIFWCVVYCLQGASICWYVHVLFTGFTHMMMETVTVSIMRQLNVSHPLHRLMAPHFFYLLAINKYVFLIKQSYVNSNDRLLKGSVFRWMYNTVI
jgi:hypothetical protein